VCAQVGNQWSRGVVTARVRTVVVRSLRHQRRGLHQSTYPVPLGRSGLILLSGARIRPLRTAPHRSWGRGAGPGLSTAAPGPASRSAPCRPRRAPLRWMRCCGWWRRSLLSYSSGRRAGWRRSSRRQPSGGPSSSRAAIAPRTSRSSTPTTSGTPSTGREVGGVAVDGWWGCGSGWGGELAVNGDSMR
jgi:hypothetical protein